MNRNFFYFSIVLFTTGMLSCNKSDTNADCNTDAATIRTITNKAGTVRKQNGDYFIIEQNTIDTRLHPCNLSGDFMVNGLPVMFSGEVKKTQDTDGTCCTENLNILKITK